MGLDAASLSRAHDRRTWATSVDNGITGDDVISYLRNHLNPTLRRGDVVVMDGPRVHRVAGVQEALAEVGAKALYLPAYSPS